MKISDATKEVSDHARLIIARQMSEILVQSRVNLSDPKAVMQCLRAAHFGVRAIAVLADRAVAMASYGSAIQAIFGTILFLIVTHSCIGEAHFD